MVKTVLLSSQLIMMHVNDFLDQKLIEHGNFEPYFDTGSLKNAISEIVQMMNFSIHQRNLKIRFDSTMVKNLSPIKFDKRRLQQVLLNLLSNACKFQTSGEILVDVICGIALNTGH